MEWNQDSKVTVLVAPRAHPGHDMRRDGGFTHNRLPPSFQPVDGCWLLVRAVVTAKTEHLHAGELSLEKVQNLLHSLSAAEEEDDHEVNYDRDSSLLYYC